MPLWLDDTLESDGNPTTTAIGRITTFGRATASISCTMFLTIQLENGAEKTVSIDMTDDIGEETEGHEIVKRVVIDSPDNGGNREYSCQLIDLWLWKKKKLSAKLP